MFQTVRITLSAKDLSKANTSIQATRIFTYVIIFLAFFGSQLCAQSPIHNKSDYLTFGQLAAHREFWPREVMVLKGIKTTRGATIPAGKMFPLYDVNATGVVLDTGHVLLQCDSSITDVLKRTSQLLASLSPQQRELTFSTLAQQQDLWPLNVMTTTAFKFDNGIRIPSDREVVFRGFEKNLIRLFDRQTSVVFLAEPFQTDLIERARQRLALPDKQPLEKKLMPVTANETGTDPPVLADSTGSVESEDKSADLLDKKFGPLRLGMKSGEAVAAIRDDGWRTTRVAGFASKGLETVQYKTSMSSKNPVVTYIQYKRSFPNSRIDFDVLRKSLVSKYGEPRHEQDLKSIYHISFGKSGPDSRDVISACRVEIMKKGKAGFEAQALGMAQIAINRWRTDGVEKVKADCPDVLPMYQQYIEALCAQQLAVTINAIKKTVTQTATWKEPERRYRRQQYLDQLRLKEEMPAATLD